MSTMVDLLGMSREELETLVARAEARLATLTRVWEYERTRAWAVGELERVAAETGPRTPDIPSGGFPPGAIVDVDGTLYVNGSGTYLRYAPGEDPISEWVAVEEAPEPGDPVDPPTPEPTEPAYPEWVQPTGAHDAYNTGDRVTHHGIVYESLVDGNVWNPTTTNMWNVVTE